MKRNLCVGAIFLTLVVLLGVGNTVLEKRAAVEAATVMAPRFEVDPLWPKPLPNHWLLGSTIGVSVDGASGPRSRSSTSSFSRTLGGTLFMALISSDPATNGVALVLNHQEDTNASLLLQEV